MLKDFIRKILHVLGYTISRIPSGEPADPVRPVCERNGVGMLTAFPKQDYVARCPPLLPRPAEVPPDVKLDHYPTTDQAIDKDSMPQYFQIRREAGRIWLTDDYPGSHYYSRQRMLQTVYDRCFPEGLAGVSFLDVGCSSGYYTFFASRAGASPAVGIDARPEHADQFKLLHAMLGLSESCCYRHVDMETELETMSETYDIVVAQGVLYHVYDQPRFLKNMYRLTNKVLVLEGECSGRADNLCIGTLEDANNIRSSLHGPAIYPSLPWMIQMARWAGFRKIHYVPLPENIEDGWGFSRLKRAMLACEK